MCSIHAVYTLETQETQDLQPVHHLYVQRNGAMSKYCLSQVVVYSLNSRGYNKFTSCTLHVYMSWTLALYI